MKRIISLLSVLFILFLLTACCNNASTEEPGSDAAAVPDTAGENTSFLVLSQNICYVDDPGENSVANRTERFRQLVQTYQPDIISTQESNSGLCNIYRNLLGQTYTMLADYPDEMGIPKYGTSNTILYRTERYELLETGTFWLSETPECKSKPEASNGYRSCTWALLRDKQTDETFLLCNTHLDWGDEAVRQQQFQILSEQMDDYLSKYPVMITGDFNAEPTGELYARVTQTLSDSYVTATENKSTTDHTYHGFYQESEIPCRLDYCFYSKHFTANRYSILTDQYGGYVSDHYGILTEFQFQ